MNLFRSRFSLSHAVGRLRKKHPYAEPVSLVGSFLLLHEVTSIVPLFVIFGGLSYFNVGPSLAERVNTELDALEGNSWLSGTLHNWHAKGRRFSDYMARKAPWLSGDHVANGIATYTIVKLLFPARIWLSMYYAPSLSSALAMRSPLLQRLGRRFLKQ